MVVHTCNSTLTRQKLEDYDFEAILGYIVSFRSGLSTQQSEVERRI